MELKFKAYRKGHIMYGVGRTGLNAEEYIKVVGHPHSGVDWTNGYGSPVRADNPGYGD